MSATVGLGNIAGVAIATLISELAAVIIGLLVYRREVNRFDPGGKSGSVWDVNKLKRTLAINIDIFIRTVCLLFAFAFLPLKHQVLVTLQ